MNVCTKDTDTGRSESIIITNGQGRLSKEEIERIVNDAEKFAEYDKILKEKIDTKNSPDSYLHSTRNITENNERFLNKIDSSDKQTIINAPREYQEWLERNQNDDSENYEEHLNSTQGVCDPIIAKVNKT